jgi:hypothetical protein
MKRKIEDQLTKFKDHLIKFEGPVRVHMVQSAIRLPQNLHILLKKAGGERGMGDEIRRRLEASFAAEKIQANPKTRELVDAISSCARETARYYGSWSEDAFAFGVLKACVNMLLAHYQPEGDAAPKPNPTKMADLLFAPDHSVADVSRLLVNDWMSDREKRALEDQTES